MHSRATSRQTMGSLLKCSQLIFRVSTSSEFPCQTKREPHCGTPLHLFNNMLSMQSSGAELRLANELSFFTTVDGAHDKIFHSTRQEAVNSWGSNIKMILEARWGVVYPFHCYPFEWPFQTFIQKDNFIADSLKDAVKGAESKELMNVDEDKLDNILCKESTTYRAQFVVPSSRSRYSCSKMSIWVTSDTHIYDHSLTENYISKVLKKALTCKMVRGFLLVSSRAKQTLQVISHWDNRLLCL